VSDDSSDSGLRRIKSSVLSRNLSLFKLSLSSGVRGAGYFLGQLANVSKETSEESRRKWLTDQADMLVKELGQLKGSVMKVGQMLSVYGEHFLPPEVNQILKKLQNQSPALNWSEIDKCLKAQLSPETLSQLKISPQALACASLGQVHLAQYQGKQIALKVQYPGVDAAIDSDLKTLRFLFNVLQILPKSEQAMDSLFSEVKDMLHQEVDYRLELKLTQEYKKAFGGDPRYIIPDVYPEFSTEKVLATSFETGVPLDSPAVLGLSQERRNRLAEAFMELYLRELLEFGMVQTDPHFGNYKVRLDPKGKNDQWVLLDFGAVRNFSKKFTYPYARMMRGSVDQNEKQLTESATEIGFLQKEDPDELKRIFTEFCYLMVEPFALQNGKSVVYKWGDNDLPNRSVALATKMMKAFHARVPPREIVFLDRKSAGSFIIMAKLKAELDNRDMLEKYIKLAGA